MFSNKRTILVSVEGIDGSGKSTFIIYLSSYLRNEGYKVVTTSEPNSFNPFWMFHKVLSKISGKEKVRPYITIIARYLDHIKYFYYITRGYDFILQDRYILSGLAYQAAIGFSPEKYLSLSRFVIKPDFIVYIHTPLEVALDRIQKRVHIYRFWEREEVLRRVKENYEKYLDVVAHKWRTKVIVVHNMYNDTNILLREVQKVAKELQNAIERKK